MATNYDCLGQMQNCHTSRFKGGETGMEMLPHPPTSPTHASRRKKLKTKRERRDEKRKDESHRVGGSESCASQSAAASASSSSLLSFVSSVTDSSVTPSTSGASVSVTSQDGNESKDKEPKDGKSAAKMSTKPEDELWLYRASTVSHILRCLGFNEKNGMIGLVNAVSDANQVLNSITAHQRLVIITGIPTQLSPDRVKQALRSTFQAAGGVDRDEIFLPFSAVETVQVTELQDKDEATGETVQGEEDVQKQGLKKRIKERELGVKRELGVRRWLKL